MSHDAYSVTRGRHRQRRPVRRALLAGLALALGALAAAAGIEAFAGGRDARTACPAPAHILRIAAAPEIAPIVARVARTGDGPGRCPSSAVAVTAVDPATFAIGTIPASGRPDVWIADSSLWLARMPGRPAAISTGTISTGTVSTGSVSTGAVSTGAVSTGAVSTGAVSAGAVSIARSPVVIAVPAVLAARLGSRASLGALAAEAARGAATRWEAAALHTAPGLGVLSAVRAAATRHPAQRASMTALLRAIITGPRSAVEPRVGLRSDAGAGGGEVLAARSEQALWLANSAGAPTGLRALYLPGAGAGLDYPFAVLTADVHARLQASAVLAALRGGAGQAALHAHGFRSPDGAAPPVLAGTSGIDRAAPAGRPIGVAQADAVRTAVAMLTRPSRLLAVLDVSGSMATIVAGQNGANRLDVARTAAARGLNLLPAASVVGLWEFSAELTPTTDYRELAPLSRLNPAGRARVGAALAQLRVHPQGGTGLYDTVLAAVGRVREHFDASRINTVVVLSDGKDEADDKNGITLAALLRGLRAQDDAARPVPVITIAYGPDSDATAMRTVSALTGGAVYTSKNPADLPRVFLDAIGQRLCRPDC